MQRKDVSWNERRSTTLRDVAQSVGVSESTASVVLNQTRSGTRVSVSTRRMVLEAAERLGYRPNSLARSLQTGRTQRLGIYSGRMSLDARNLFFAELLGGLCDGAGEVGHNLLMHTAGDQPDTLLDLISNRAIDGLIVHARADDPILAVLDNLRVPAVAVVDSSELLPSVCVDDASGGVIQARHLAQLGHRSVIYKQSEWRMQSAINRMHGFLQVAEELGIEVTVHHDLPGDAALSPRDISLLTRPKNPATAIVGWNEYVADLACRNLRDMGIDVPSKVAVMGFDGFRRFYEPRFELTTIRAPWSEVGRVAVHKLTELVAGHEVPHLTVLPVEFVRGSTT